MSRKFQVHLSLNNLSSIPFVNGILFAKLKLKDGGKLTALSSRKEINNHSVAWEDTFPFTVKISAQKETAMLDTCSLKISIRKESKGGKAFDKLGFVKVNISEFAGTGKTERRYILDGYEGDRRRQDNSVLKITVTMTLLDGDPCFKAPLAPSLPQGADGLASAIIAGARDHTDSLEVKQQKSNNRLSSQFHNYSLGAPLSSKGLGEDRPVAAVIERSRVDASDVIDDLLKNTGDLLLAENTDEEGAGVEEPSLRLYVSQDGTASVTARRR